MYWGVVNVCAVCEFWVNGKRLPLGALPWVVQCCLF